MGDDSGRLLFKPLFNVEALNFFVNNEMNNSENVVDYFDEETFSDTLLQDEYLLISMYVHYLHLTLSNNFKRRMKEKKWIGKVVEKKLIRLKEELSKKFGKNVKGREHWNEIEFIRRMLVQHFPTNFNVTIGLSQPMVNLTRSNCILELSTYPTYIMRYVNKGTKSYIEKVFSCGDDESIFSCVLLLKNDHYLNVWDYLSLFNEIDCPDISKKKRNKGSGERNKKLFFIMMHGFFF